MFLIFCNGQGDEEDKYSSFVYSSFFLSLSTKKKKKRPTKIRKKREEELKNEREREKKDYEKLMVKGNYCLSLRTKRSFHI